MTGQFNMTGVVTQVCSVKKVFSKISQNLQENTFARIFIFLIKLQALDSGRSVFLSVFRNF